MLEIAICDDDKADLNFVIEIVREIFKHNEIEYNLQAFDSAKAMLGKVKRIDIAILDISMEELNGIELGRALKIRYPEVKLIYTTSFEEYYMQAINDAHAFSFLCKPLERDKLQKQLLDLIKEISYSNYSKEKNFYQVLDDKMKELPVVKLRLNDIIYFEYLKSMRKVSIVLEERTYKCSYVMEKLAEELESYGFSTNCRGQLVNLRYISKIKGYDIYLHSGEKLRLSQKRAVEFKKIMNDFLHDNNS
jgi:DNA-binding LytR/AlgR family response regulator